MTRILVTGGCGFIGSHLIDRLEKETIELTVVDNLRRSVKQEFRSPRVRVHEMDIRDRDALRHEMRGVDMVYHLAAQANVLGAIHDTDYAFTSNIVGTYNVVTCASECGVQRLIFASSREVYGEVTSLPVGEEAPVAPKNVYGATKAAGELLCRSSAGSMQVIVLRLANVYGPRDRGRVIPLFVEHASRNQPLTIFGHDKVLDFVWVGDVVKALVDAASNALPQGPINIGSGQGTTLPELASQILRLTGSNSGIQYALPREMEVDRFVADITRARQVLKFSPSPPLLHLNDVVEDLRQSNSCQA